MECITAKAHARAGLLGNPSDVYEGKAIAIIVRNFTAEVTLTPDDRFRLIPGPADSAEFATFGEMAAATRERGCYGGLRLMRAAIKKFTDHWEGYQRLDAADPRGRFAMSYRSDVPRQAGLAGSSALVIAALRALARWFEIEIEPHRLAELALAAEVEELGITAGPMDRVVQAYEGAICMDFKEPRTTASYTPLSPSLLPPLFIAWDPRTGESSGKVHGDVRLRWLKGDEDVRRAIATFPKLVDEGMRRLREGDVEGFKALVNKNFDTRASIWNLGERDREIVKIGRCLGAGVKFCGSGGSAIGVMSDSGEFQSIREAYEAKGFCAVRPVIEPGPADGGAQ